MSDSTSRSARVITITGVRIQRVHDSHVRALGSIEIDGEFVVRHLEVIERKGIRFVAMPNRRLKDGHLREFAFPITRKARKTIQRAVLDAYDADGGSEGAGVGSRLRPTPPRTEWHEAKNPPPS